MTDIDLTAAKMEAARRWPSRNIRDPLPSDWLNEGMASGFVLGTQWALAQVEARVKPDREAVARAIHGVIVASAQTGRIDIEVHDSVPSIEFERTIADSVLALLPGKTEQEVRADMLDALIDRYLHGSRASHAMPDHVISWIRSQPEYKARYVGAVSG